MYIFGPVFRLDMARMARRRWCFLARSIYASAIFAGVFVMYLFVDREPSALDPRSLALFSEDFLTVFLAAQFLCIVVVAQFYLIGAVAEEREKRTWESLLVTALSENEIVLGKLASRLASLALLLLTGLPIVFLLQFLGGLGSAWIWGSFGLTLTTSLTVACVYLLHSVAAPRPRNDVVPALVGMILFGTAGGACIWLSRSLDSLAPLLTLGTVELGVIAVYLRLVFRRARQARNLAEAGSPHEATVRDRWWPKKRPSVWDWPMFWKDWHDGIQPEGLVTGTVFFGMILGAFTLFLFDQLAIAGPPDVTTWIRFIGTGGCVLLLAAVAIIAAGPLVSEREKRTLDSLLVTPLSCRDILAAKWWNSLAQPCVGFLLLAAFWVVAVVCGSLHVRALPALALTLLVHAAFFASLGLAIGTYCATGPQAQAWVGGVFVLMITGLPAGILIPLVLWLSGNFEWSAIAGFAVTPALVLFAEHFPANPSAGSAFDDIPISHWVAGGIAGALAYAAASIWLWRFALARFDRNCGRVDGFAQGKAPASQPAIDRS